MSKPRVVVYGHPEFGKSTLIVLAALWILGNDPSKRLVFGSGTATQAERMLGMFMRTVETSAELALIFPTMKPGRVWTRTEASIATAPATLDAANIRTAAPGSDSILGTRADHIFLDDLCGRGNTRSKDQRDELDAWYVTTIASRFAPNAHLFCSGTVWHPDDQLHRIASAPGVHVERFPLLDAKGNSTWPTRWPLARIESRRQELGSAAFTLVCQCVDLDPHGGTFKAEWIDAAIAKGATSPDFVHNIPIGRIYIGVDPAFSVGPSADLTAIAAVLAYDNGEREVLEIIAGKWPLPAIAERVTLMAQKWRAAKVMVESNSGGTWLVDELKGARVHGVEGIHTGSQNKDAALAALSGEFEFGKWRLHNPRGGMTDDMIALRRDLLAYTPDEHLPDRVSAVILALQGIRLAEQRPRIRWTTKASLGIRNL